jgi:hypothetical protein
MLKAPNFEFIEVVVPYQSAATRFTIPDQPQLRFTSMVGLETYYAGDTPLSALSGNALPNQSTFLQTTITLYADDRELIHYMPLTDLHATWTGNNNIERSVFAGQQIVWSKSYIQTAQGFDWTGYTGPISFVFGVYYQ